MPLATMASRSQTLSHAPELPSSEEQSSSTCKGTNRNPVDFSTPPPAQLAIAYPHVAHLFNVRRQRECVSAPYALVAHVRRVKRMIEDFVAAHGRLELDERPLGPAGVLCQNPGCSPPQSICVFADV